MVINKKNTTVQETTIDSPERLIELLFDQIESTKRQFQNAIFIAGHLPLVYEDGPRLDVNRWGEFSKHTLEVAAEVGDRIKKIGINTRIAVIVDDLWELKKGTGFPRNFSKFYQRSSLPAEFTEVLDRYDLQDSLILQERKGFNSKLISEYKELTANRSTTDGEATECAKAFRSFTNNPSYFDPATDYLIGFIPGQCRGNLCSITSTPSTTDRFGSSTMIFYPHVETMSGLVLSSQNAQEKFYRSTQFEEAQTVEQIYQNGVTMQTTTLVTT